MKKDPATGRWFKIKEAEARDKVGHAIRKAVQRLEDTRPKMAERLRKQNSANPRQPSESQSSSQKKKSEEPATRNTVVAQNDESVARAAPRFLHESTSATSAESSLFTHGRLSGAALPSLLSTRDALSASQLMQTDALSRSQLLSGTLSLGSSQLAAHGLLPQNQSLPTTVPYEQALGRSLEFAAGAKARGDALLNVIKEREQKRLQEMEYASRLMLSARRQEDQLASLLTGSGSVQNPLLTNPSNPYAWFSPTLPPRGRNVPDNETALSAGRREAEEDKRAGIGTLPKRSLR